jgi:shikimate kinase
MAPPVNALQQLPLDRTVVLIGMMGAGKTAVGMRLAKTLGWSFQDADAAIEAAAGTTISNIFAEIAKALSVWLRADLDTLVRRTGRPGKRPLLAQGDPRARLTELLEQRSPIYAEADLVVDSGNAPIATVVNRVLEALAAHADGAAP